MDELIQVEHLYIAKMYKKLGDGIRKRNICCSP